MSAVIATNAARWVPGTSYGLAWPGGMALLSDGVGADVAEHVWTVMREGGDLSSYVEALGAAVGGSLRSIPGFAVALVRDDVVHIAVRRPFLARMSGLRGEETIDGNLVSTWVERICPQVTAITLVGETAPATAALPVCDGIVPVSAMTLVLGPEGPDAPAAASPAEDPHTEPAVLQPAVLPPAVLPPELPDDEPAAQPGRFASLWSEQTLHGLPGPPARAAQDRDEFAPMPSVPTMPPLPTMPMPMAMPMPVASPAPMPVAQSLDTGPVAPDGQALDLGDHDGMTIIPSAVAARRSLGLEVPAGGHIPCVLCGGGHANPPTRTRCRICSAPLGGAPVVLPRGSVGRARLSTTGEFIDLVGSVIAGRHPFAAQIQGPSMPTLLTLSHNHISGTHLEIRVDGWAVEAVDLQSTNGTFLRRSGQSPSRLTERPVRLLTGDVLDLGHGVELALQDLP